MNQGSLSSHINHEVPHIVLNASQLMKLKDTNSNFRGTSESKPKTSK